MAKGDAAAERRVVRDADRVSGNDGPPLPASRRAPNAACVASRPGKPKETGAFAPHSSSLCNWTDAAPGSYWMPVGGAENAANAHDNTTGAAPYTPSCSAITFAGGDVWIRLREIKRVQIVSMSHLDVGYTGSMSYTLNSYFSTFFPRAIELQTNLTKAGHTEKLHYITHSWLVYLYLHCDELPALGFTNEPVACPTTAAKAAFSAAVRAGTITWHAGPMNQQVEWMSAEMFKFGVNVSHSLDDAFGLPHKTVLSQRDVPGMTRGVVPLLAERNVTGITVGENGGFCAPNVPYPLFRWEVGGASVVTAYHPGGYPDMYACPHANMLYCTENNAATMARRDCLMSGDQAFCFAFRTDNTGPPESIEEVVAGFKVAATQFPGASIEAGSLDDFFGHAQSDTTLPTVTGEVGDIWIVGIGSDPKKASTVRRMQRAWDQYSQDMSLAKAGTILLKLTEHTWGDGGLHNASADWSNAVLQTQLKNHSFDYNIDGWKQQRAFSDVAHSVVPDAHPLKAEWGAILDNKPPVLPDLATHTKVKHTGGAWPSWKCHGQSVSVDGHGTLRILGMSIGKMSYGTRSEDVYNASKSDGMGHICSAAFGGKVGSAAYGGATGYCEHEDPVAKKTVKRPCDAVSYMAALYTTKGSGRHEEVCDFWAEVNFDEIKDVGAPGSSWLHFNITEKRLNLELRVLDKVPTRFNEAGWLGFEGATGDPAHSEWSLTKLGTELSFGEVVRGGSPQMHSVDLVTAHLKESSGEPAHMVTIDSLDAPLLSAIGTDRPPSVLLNRQMETMKDVFGVHFNLWNNAWSTNYPFFYPFLGGDKDIRYEFDVVWRQ